MSRHTALLERAAAAAKAAREIAEKADAENREMTEVERHDFEAKAAEAVELKANADAAKKDDDLTAQMKAMAEEIGLQLPSEEEIGALTGKPLEKQVTGSPQFKRMIQHFGGHIPEKARVQSDPIQVKSLFVGSSDSSAGAFVTPEDSGIVEMLGRRELVLRDLISVRRTGSDAVEYVRQLTHTNAAAPVPEATSSAKIDGTTVTTVTGGVKPEGSWTFQRETATVKTIAEWVPATKRALADVSALEGLIRDELVKDLAEEEEDQIVSGDGSGENLTGILNTSGVQTQAFDTDIFTTVRRALGKVRKIGRSVPNGILMHPTDVETIDLAREDGTTGKFLGLGPWGIGPRTLWGVPVVESEAVGEGTPIVGDFKKAVLWDRENATVTITDSHDDFFIRNLVAILAEERVAFAVTRPSAFVKATVTGA